MKQLFCLFLLVLTGCSNSTPDSPVTGWRSLDSKVADKIYDDNFESKDLKAVTLDRIITKDIVVGNKTFKIFDFKQPQLCGAIGCPYSVYASDKLDVPIARFYLYPHPDSISVDRNSLVVRQLESGNPVRYRYEFDPIAQTFKFRDKIGDASIPPTGS